MPGAWRTLPSAVPSVESTSQKAALVSPNAVRPAFIVTSRESKDKTPLGAGRVRESAFYHVFAAVA